MTADAPRTSGSAALKGQIARFGLVGIANVGVDLGVYAGLLALGAPISPAKAGAFVCGTVFAFFVNKNYTFRAGRGDIRKFAAFFALYVVSMTVNVGTNAAIIGMIGESFIGKAAGYCAALFLSASMNFIGMRQILLPRGAADEKAGR